LTQQQTRTNSNPLNNATPHPHPLPPTPPRIIGTQNLKIMQFNSDRIQNKFHEQFLTDENIDVAAIQETSHTHRPIPDRSPTTPASEQTVHRQTHQTKTNGGGPITYIKHDIPTKSVNPTNFPN
jgi:hypothetical protein